MSVPPVSGNDRRAALNATMLARVRQLLDSGYTGPITLHCKDGALLRIEYRQLESVDHVLKNARQRARRRHRPGERDPDGGAPQKRADRRDAHPSA